jgi:hypothetical protein
MVSACGEFDDEAAAAAGRLEESKGPAAANELTDDAEQGRDVVPSARGVEHVVDERIGVEVGGA